MLGRYAFVSAGGEHALCVPRSGDEGGGNGNAVVADASRPSEKPKTYVLHGASAVRCIAAGSYHNLVASQCGKLYAWGVGVFKGANAKDGCIPALGQTGAIDEVVFPTPVPLPQSEKVMALAAGAYHSVVLTQTAKVFTFGAAQLGQLGRDLGHNPPQTDGSGLPVDDTPAEVTGLPSSCTPDKIGAGFYNTYVLCKKGTGVYCSGENQNGQCGARLPNNLLTMEGVPELKEEKIAHVEGGYCHTLALTSDGRLLSMGCGEDGQRGCGVFADDDDVPLASVTEVPLPEKIKAVSAGLNHSLALTSGGQVYAWGSNEYGQLGCCPDDEEAQALPVRVGGLPQDGHAVSVSAGGTHSHVHYQDGRVYSFGGGTNGQLIDGAAYHANFFSNTPLQPQSHHSEFDASQYVRAGCIIQPADRQVGYISGEECVFYVL